MGNVLSANLGQVPALEGKGGIPAGYLAKALGYTVGYVGAILALALALFEDRELS